MIRRDDEGQKEFAFFVDVDLSEADPFALRLGKFYERHPNFARESGTVLDEGDAALCVERFTRGAHLVGAVPNFDSETLDTLLRDNGLLPAWHYHLVDIEAVAAGYLNALAALNHTPLVSLPWKSDDLSVASGVNPPSNAERHTAMGDAKWVMRWYDRLMT